MSDDRTRPADRIIAARDRMAREGSTFAALGNTGAAQMVPGRPPRPTDFNCRRRVLGGARRFFQAIRMARGSQCSTQAAQDRHAASAKPMPKGPK